MTARRKKSLMFGSAPDTTVFHREHRSKKGRKIRRHEQSKSQFYKKLLEKMKKYDENEII